VLEENEPAPGTEEKEKEETLGLSAAEKIA